MWWSPCWDIIYYIHSYYPSPNLWSAWRSSPSSSGSHGVRACWWNVHVRAVWKSGRRIIWQNNGRPPAASTHEMAATSVNTCVFVTSVYSCVFLTRVYAVFLRLWVICQEDIYHPQNSDICQEDICHPQFFFWCTFLGLFLQLIENIKDGKEEVLDEIVMEHIK